jgi:Zn-dependent protease
VDTAAISFRIGPVPVTIRPSIVVLLAVIGFLVDDSSPTRIGLWTVIGVGSILIHEMGHAAVALALGGHPKVQLMGLGGATDPGLERRPDRLHSAMLSLAGPGAGLLVGAAVWVIMTPDLHALRSDQGLGAFVVATVLWMNIGWSVLNLLPVLPLDGGRLLTEALPGDPVTRSRRGYLASAVLGMIVAVVLLSLNEPFAGLLFGFLATQSFTAWRTLRARTGQAVRVAALRDLHERLGEGDDAAEARLREMVDHPNDGPIARTMLLDHFVRTGRADDADALTQGPGKATPTATFLVEVMKSGGERGVDSLVEAFRRAPSTLAAQHLVLGLHAAGRDDEIMPIIESVATTDESASIVFGAQHAAHQAESFAAAVELGALAYRIDPRADGLAAFNVACSLARLGDTDAALAWIGAAIERGLSDPSVLDTDPDLAELRTRSEFTDVRRRSAGG